MVSRTRTLLVALLVLAGLACGEESAPATVAPYRRVGPFYPGYASVPWHAAFSADGRWVAFVEGHVNAFVAVHDAKSREQVWRIPFKGQPASHGPVFTADGESLVLVEGQDLVVRTRGEEGWAVRERTPLGFTPSITAYARSLLLAPDEQSVALCDDGRAYRVDLGGTTRTSRDLGLSDAVAVHHLREGFAVARWSERVAETVLAPAGGAEPRVLPVAVLAVSPDGATWLAARSPRPEREVPPTLHLMDAASGAVLGAIPLWGDEVRGWAFLVTAQFSPDGRHLATVESLRMGFLREARTGRLLQRISEYEGDRMIGLAFSPDGRHLVTGGRRAEEAVGDEAVLLWERVPDVPAVPAQPPR